MTPTLTMDAKKTENPEEILVIGPSWVGDMVMAQVLFKRLKIKNPGCSITVLAPDWTRPILDRMPEVEFSIPDPTGHGELALEARRSLGISLRRRQFTMAIILPNSFKSALIPYHAKIPRRIAWRGEFRGMLLTDSYVLNKEKFPLMVQRFAALAEFKQDKPPQNIAQPRLNIDPNNLTYTLQKLELDPKSEEKILAICPGAEFGVSKQWPAEHFASSCRPLIADGWKVWIFGSANDETIAGEILGELNDTEQQSCVNLCGKTSLEEAIDLLSLVKVVISNDSGLMHISAALDKPVIALYGSTSPEFTPPMASKVRLLATDIECRPCFKRNCPYGHQKCMQDLKPELALNAVADLTAEL